MNNYLTDDTKAILLLCGVMGKDKEIKPLALKDYNKLALWLRENGLRPSDLLESANVERAANGASIDFGRLKALMERGVVLGFAVEEWQRNGIWLLSRSDSEYPVRLKRHLKGKAPALLFGVGDQSLLRGGGVGIVGSRNVDDAGQQFTIQVAEQCVRAGMPVVSGGARGVDQISMKAAMDAGGATIGILAENLLKKSLERSARKAIADGQLLLISPYHPNARFTVGTAMGRNKLIYAMADYGLVVSADHKKGGTWAGAEEELKRDKHVPVFVRGGSDAPLGNTKLLDLGAVVWPKVPDASELRKLLDKAASAAPGKAKQEELGFSSEPPVDKPTPKPEKIEEKQPEPVEEPPPVETNTGKPAEPAVDKPVVSAEAVTPAEELYQAVLPILLKNLNEPISADDLAKTLEVGKTQLNAWLKRAVADKVIKKLNKPVRYIGAK
ncbi:DNA-processing protein DprA [Pontiellaceae bacterium B1224]|nr:DNA-processing protein DprA [Pontiellaceae bacterium B1224]